MADADSVNKTALSQLLAHELPISACKEALRRFGNDADAALDFLYDTEEGQELADLREHDEHDQRDQASANDELPAAQEPDSAKIAELRHLVHQTLQVLDLEADAGARIDRELRAFSEISACPATLGQLLVDPREKEDNILLKFCTAASPEGMTAQAISWLLASRADANVQNVLGETPLAVAVRTASSKTLHSGLNVVQELLEARADPNASDVQGETPLMEAVCMGNVELCKFLLVARADVDQKCENGMTPGTYAKERPAVADLFRQMQDMEAAAEQERKDRLIAEFNQVIRDHDAVNGRRLLSEHADILAPTLNVQDEKGQTMIFEILKPPQNGGSWESLAECVHLLVEHRADPNLQNSEGTTPALYATRAASSHCEADILLGFSVALGALFSARADPNIRESSTGDIPLIEAACIGSMPMCKVLLDAGADVNLESHTGLKASDFIDATPELIPLFAKCSHPSTAPTPARAPAPAPAPAAIPTVAPPSPPSVTASAPPTPVPEPAAEFSPAPAPADSAPGPAAASPPGVPAATLASSASSPTPACAPPAPAPASAPPDTAAAPAGLGRTESTREAKDTGEATDDQQSIGISDCEASDAPVRQQSMGSYSSSSSGQAVHTAPVGISSDDDEERATPPEFHKPPRDMQAEDSQKPPKDIKVEARTVEEPKSKIKHRTEGASGELAAKLNKINERIQINERTNGKDAADAHIHKQNGVEVQPQATSERPPMLLSEFLAKARNAPQANRAALPEKKSLGALVKYSEMRELVGAVEAHSAEIVSERMLAVEDILRSGLVDFLADARDLDGYSILHRCILAPPMQNNWEHMLATVEALLLKRASVNCANLHGETPLLFAMREHGGGQHSWRLIKALVKQGADSNLADVEGITPLTEAVRMRDAQQIQLLLDHGGDAFLSSGPQHRSIYEELSELCPEIAGKLAAQHGIRSSTSAEANGGTRKAYTIPRLQSREVIMSKLQSSVQMHNVQGVRKAIEDWAAENWRPFELLSKVDDDGHGWLHLCLLAPPYGLCWRAATDVLQELLNAKVDVNRTNSRGETPLCCAAREASGGFKDRVELMRTLLNARANIDQGTQNGRTPLMETTAAADTCLCELLLCSDADPTKADQMGVSAAKLAASVPSLASMFKDITGVDCSEFRRSKGGGADKQSKAQPAGRGSELRRTALQHDVRHLSELLRSSFEKDGPSGMDFIQEADADGHTALHMCIVGPPAHPDREAQVTTLDFLLKARAKPDLRNRAGETALLMAVREAGGSRNSKARMLVMNVLLRAGADVNMADSQGVTSLMEAARKDDAELVKLFLTCGGKADVVDKCGKCAIDFAPQSSSVRELFISSRKNGKEASNAASGGENGRATKNGSGAHASKIRLMFQAVHAHDFRLLSDIFAAYKADGKKFDVILDTQDADGHALLHSCIFTPPTSGLDRSLVTKTAKVLLEAKADANLPNAAGETVLLIAVRETAGTRHSSRLELFRTLLDAGAKLDLADHQDTTPLMEASALADEEICALLLDRGANMHLRGRQGLTAKELARNPRVKRVFEEKASKAEPAPADKEVAPTVKLTLRHLTTQLERIISISGDASMVDVKKAIVRFTRGGSWQRIAILSDQHRVLHDSEHLNGRHLLITADAESAEVQKAADAALSDEERWQNWSLEELLAEAKRRGVYCGSEQSEVLANLLQVKRWESLSSKDLRAECARRGLLVDCCPDRTDLLFQLFQDFSWETMKDEVLRAELNRFGLPIPHLDKPGSMDKQIRLRLRMLARWMLLPIDQLRKTCEVRNLETKGKTRDELLDFLKTFKPLPKATPPPPPEAKAPAAPKMPTPPQKKGSSSDDSYSKPSSESGQTSFRDHSERVKNWLEKYPGFSGEVPDEIEEWSDKDIEAYLYTNGTLRPKPKKVSSKMPRKKCYEILGLPDGSPVHEVRKCYRRLALQYHPDKNLQDPEKNADKFKLINEAYEVLNSIASPGQRPM